MEGSLRFRFGHHCEPALSDCPFKKLSVRNGGDHLYFAIFQHVDWHSFIAEKLETIFILSLLLHSSISMYADDTVIYYSGSEVSNIRETLQEDLNRVEQWLTDSKLILNQSKTKGLLFGTRQLLQTTSDFVLQMQGKDIERVTKFTYLGTMLDEQLHWKEHIDTTCNKVNKRLGLLARIRSCLTLKAAKYVYITLIDPILSYTDTAWGELSVGSGKSLQWLKKCIHRVSAERVNRVLSAA